MKSNNYNIEANSDCRTRDRLYAIAILNWRFDPMNALLKSSSQKRWI